jgi:hypothetical protein
LSTLLKQTVLACFHSVPHVADPNKALYDSTSVGQNFPGIDLTIKLETLSKLEELFEFNDRITLFISTIMDLSSKCFFRQERIFSRVL